MPSRRPRPAALTRDRVARAALALVEAEGPDAVSMRRVADALGVKAMSLYAHVADKADLLDAVVEAAFADFPVPPPGPWRDRLRALGVGYRRWALAHPGAFALLAARPLPAGEQLRLLDLTLGLLGEAGFTPAEAAAAFHAIGAFVYGAALTEVQGMTAGQDGRAAYLGRLVGQLEAGGAGRFPAAYPARDGLLTRDPAADFESGLDALLDGLAARPAGRSG